MTGNFGRDRKHRRVKQNGRYKTISATVSGIKEFPSRTDGRHLKFGSGVLTGNANTNQQDMKRFATYIIRVYLCEYILWWISFINYLFIKISLWDSQQCRGDRSCPKLGFVWFKSPINQRRQHSSFLTSLLRCEVQ